MDLILLSKNNSVIEGLKELLNSFDSAEELVHAWIEVKDALYIVEIAKRAEDKPEWFPSGKCATIQAIQARIDREFIRFTTEKEK